MPMLRSEIVETYVKLSDNSLMLAKWLREVMSSVLLAYGLAVLDTDPPEDVPICALESPCAVHAIVLTP
jgi:hypothetical protein